MIPDAGIPSEQTCISEVNSNRVISKKRDAPSVGHQPNSRKDWDRRQPGNQPKTATQTYQQNMKKQYKFMRE